jgi:hypothetical protein
VIKTTILLFSLLILNSVIAGGDVRISENGTIEIEIVGLRSDKGDVKIAECQHTQYNPVHDARYSWGLTR